jgi:hypothetical protein
MRLAPIDAAVTRLLDFNLSSDVPLMQVGSIIGASGTMFDTTSNVGNWGNCEVMSVSSNGAAAILPGTVVHWDKNFRISATAAAASEVNKGWPVAITLTNFQIGSTTEQYGWVLVSGTCPAAFSVAATTGTVFVGTAGKLTPTAAAGGQLLNAQTLIAGASTFTRSGTTKTGSSVVKFPNVGGMYVGQAISGTGIPASSVISALPPDGASVLIGSAVGTLVTATASATVTCTMTNTGYGIIQCHRPFVQGQIT